jgi:tetratricopeptide (TPR) repeat protein
VKKLIFIIFILPFLSNCGNKKEDNLVNENNIEYITTDDGIVETFNRDKYPILQEGVLLKLAGKTQQAIDKFNEAEKKYGELKAIYLNRGAAYTQSGRNNEAISDFSKCLEIDKNYLPALLNRGIAYVHLNKIELGIIDINRAIQIKPNEPASYLNRAVAYKKNNEIDLACADLKKAKSLGLMEKYGSEMTERMLTDLSCMEN